MTKHLTIIRPSSLSGYGDCPRREAAKLFRFEIEAAGFLLRETATGIAPVLGTAVHEGAADILRTKLKTGEPGSLDSGTEVGIESLNQAMQKGAVFDTKTETRRVAEKQVRRMVRVFHEQLAPKIAPIAVETRLEAKIEDGFVLGGTADNETIEPGAIRDLKTGVASRTHAAQLGAYSLLSRSHGRLIHHGKVDFIQRVAPNKEQPPAVTTTYPVKDIEQLAISRVRRVIGDLKEFRARVEHDFGPPEYAFDVNPMSSLCSDKWCPAWGTSFCKEWEYKEQQ